MVDDRIENIKIAVHNKEESRQAQEKLFELGASWYRGVKKVKHTSNSYLFVSNHLAVWAISTTFNDKRFFDEAPEEEIYFDDLMAMEAKKEDNWNWRINCRQHLGDIECMRTLKEKILENIKALNDEEFGYLEIEEIINKLIGDLK